MTTVESTLKGHPDKICDQIADKLLDEFLMHDPESRVAIEVMGTRNRITLGGEVTSKHRIPPTKFVSLINRVLLECGSEPVGTIAEDIQQQSPEINKLSKTGAGDSGIVYGYATNETENMMPKIINEVHRRAKSYFDKYGGDGKVQLTRDNKGKIREVASVQGRDFKVGGFEADTGLTGRKTQVDTYCGLINHGGGAFSGKDPTKIDRSAAYMARWLAKHYVKKWNNDFVEIALAYEIGKPQPVMIEAKTGMGIMDSQIIDDIKKNFDLSAEGIIKKFDLQKPIYYDTASYGHFGDLSYPWENNY